MESKTQERKKSKHEEYGIDKYTAISYVVFLLLFIQMLIFDFLFSLKILFGIIVFSLFVQYISWYFGKNMKIIDYCFKRRGPYINLSDNSFLCFDDLVIFGEYTLIGTSEIKKSEINISNISDLSKKCREFNFKAMFKNFILFFLIIFFIVYALITLLLFLENIVSLLLNCSIYNII